MRTNNLTSMLFATLFCCCFSVSLPAQKFLKKLDKFVQKVEKTSNDISKVNNSMQTVRKEVVAFTGTESQQESEQESDETAAPSITEQNQTASAASKTIKQENSSTQPTVSKMKTADPVVKIASGESKNISINGGIATVRNMLGSYTLQVLDCKGNSGDQTVTITFVVEHQLPNQTLHIIQKDTKAYAKGQDYTNINRYVGSKLNHNMIPTDIPMECRVVIRNVVPSIKSFDSVMLNMKTQNKDGGKGDQKGTLEFKNLNIMWN